jgi:CheY-like chemotaxis protein
VYTHAVDTSANSADRLLVIDDDAIMCELLSVLLGAEGNTVLTAGSGEDALALLSALAPAQLPNVILADLKMPGVSHSALAVRLRLACPPAAVLLAMSASEPAASEIAGFSAFLLKPFNVSDYDDTVEKARRQDPGPSTAKARPKTRKPHAPLVPALDEAIFTKLSSVMGAAQVSQIYMMFLDDAGGRASRMSEAAVVNDGVAFIREAHSIKGGCGMLGATELYSLAGRMETGGLACTSLLDDFGPAFERLRRILTERMDQHVEEPAELQP